MITNRTILVGLVQIIDNMNTITLKDGRLKHTTGGWVGYQNPNESIAKTKWYKDGVKYWEVKGSKNTYIVKTNGNNLLECECCIMRQVWLMIYSY